MVRLNTKSNVRVAITDGEYLSRETKASTGGILGVDPHKKKHAAVAITQDFTMQAKFKCDNTREGLEMMLRQAKMEMMKSVCRGVMFAIETGGHYWRNVAYFLDEKGIAFRFINQYTLKRRLRTRKLMNFCNKLPMIPTTVPSTLFAIPLAGKRLNWQRIELLLALPSCWRVLLWRLKYII